MLRSFAIPGLSLRSNPWTELANAFGVYSACRLAIDQSDKLRSQAGYLERHWSY